MFPCKVCKTELTYLQTKDKEHTGKVLVEWSKLSRDERISLQDNIPVPYDETEHKNKIHHQFCLAYIPKCNKCLEPIIFVKSKDDKNIPVNFWKASKEDRYRFILGLPVEYRPLDHHLINHFALCEARKRSNKDVEE